MLVFDFVFEGIMIGLSHGSGAALRRAGMVRAFVLAVKA
jgi:hypothetical protein